MGNEIQFIFTVSKAYVFPRLYNIYQLVYDYKTESIIKTILPYNMGNLKSG